jgi:1-deoxy-D-xylulose-5-phosphate reductoisomerase
MRRIAVLGSTGSIGRQTLDVVRWHPDEFQVVALVASRSSSEFELQLAEFQPRISCLTSVDGIDPLLEIATDPDVDLLVVATSGTVGFKPTITALASGKPVALAKKETLIMAGHLVTEASSLSGAPLLPIDSEHSAIWQCLQGEQPYAERVHRLLLTASGGAFRDRAADSLADVTPEEALKHPTWSMGPKITIDSATLMNKGLEVIEAHELFGIDFDRIDVVVHPQSIVHSMVEFVDGATIAQLSMPDMRLPIALALAAPERFPEAFGAIDWRTLGTLSFEVPDLGTFRCLALAYEAGRTGGTAPAVLSAANEVAVEAFLADRIGWLDIAAVVEETLHAGTGNADDIADVLDADRRARERAVAIVHARSSR